MDKFHPLVFILIWLYNTDINFDTCNAGNFKSWTNPNCKWDKWCRQISNNVTLLIVKPVSYSLSSVFLITYTHIFVIRDLQCSVMGIYFLHPVTGHSLHPLCGLDLVMTDRYKVYFCIRFFRGFISYIYLYTTDCFLHNFGKLDSDYGD